MFKKDSIKIFFMGTPEFAVPSLEALAKEGYNIVGVATQPDRPRGRGRKLLPSPIKELAIKLNLQIFQPEKAKDPNFIEEVAKLEPDFIVVAAYGQILTQKLLDVPKIMPINVHGSLLPKYRGAAPIQWAIINGETETGITIMKMDAGMDTGPILLQKALRIDPFENFGNLYNRMAKLGAEALLEAIDGILAGSITPKEQPSEGVSYAPPIKREMLRINWEKDDAQKIVNIIRAFDPKPGAYTIYENERLRLYNAFFVPDKELKQKELQASSGTVIRADDNALIIKAIGSGAVGIKELQWPGKKRLFAADFLRGRPIPVGYRFK